MADEPVPSPRATSGSAADEVVRLGHELDEIRQREAQSRLKAAREFVRRRAEFEKLRAELAQKNQDREDLVIQLEAFTHLLATTEDVRTAFAQKVARMQASFSWQITQPWRALTKVFRREKKPVADMDGVSSTPREPAFVYYFYTTPFQIWKTNQVTLRGWVIAKAPKRISSVRAKVDERVFAGNYGREESEVQRAHGLTGEEAKPGFEIQCELPPGRHVLKVEALIGERDWQVFFQAPVWRR